MGSSFIVVLTEVTLHTPRQIEVLTKLVVKVKRQNISLWRETNYWII